VDVTVLLNRALDQAKSRAGRGISAIEAIATRETNGASLCKPVNNNLYDFVTGDAGYADVNHRLAPQSLADKAGCQPLSHAG
jgi:hypothetical protein